VGGRQGESGKHGASVYTRNRLSLGLDKWKALPGAVAATNTRACTTSYGPGAVSPSGATAGSVWSRRRAGETRVTGTRAADAAESAAASASAARRGASRQPDERAMRGTNACTWAVGGDEGVCAVRAKRPHLWSIEYYASASIVVSNIDQLDHAPRSTRSSRSTDCRLLITYVM